MTVTEPELAYTIHPGGRVDPGATVGERCNISGTVAKSAVLGQNCTVERAAQVSGRCGAGVKIGPTAQIGHGAILGDYATVGPGCVIHGHVGWKMIVPTGARIPTGCLVVRRGDVLTVGPVGSEGDPGRIVSIVRQEADNHARIVVGCWREHQGGSPGQLEERIRDGKRWVNSNWPASTHAAADLYHAQYEGIVFTARLVEAVWLTYPPPPDPDI